ncbi:SbcC/MukB-like Walker B domain-containing protein [Belliella pelovolcani]|uniref:Exonuclease SbcC n=1 Tax=Belliella pelovolcani TaxID=529505 RepID=A0A1N7MG23_9BACT|nr:SMC family ATPase [Belliella pelovolcani]SIS84941.1 exonuclease SbcC [Belliella pelovolcani]
MIPIRLEIQGLYSYKEKQVIEFDQLTAAGLFGIFGAVGSGKSSILEAVLLALYGSTERLSDRGEKYSMVNLQSEELLINFEFKAGKNNSKIYRARYAAKRNAKKFEDVKPAEHGFYLQTEEGWAPLTSRGEDIVGMKKEHFKQTVIIPQGKFKEFVDLTPGPRAEMMKELFGLERFDLSQKTGSLLRVVKDEKIRLETQLGSLEAFSEEVLKTKEKQLKAIAHQAEIITQEFQKVEIQFKKQEQIQTLHQSLLNFEKEWTALQLKKPEIEKQKSIYKDFLTARTYLKPIFDQIQEKKQEIEKHQVSVTDCERFKKTFVSEIAAKEKEEAELKEKANKKSERESKIRDLEKVKEIQELQVKIKALSKEIDLIQPQLDSKKSTQLKLEAAIKMLEDELETQALPNANQLAELKSWLKDLETWTSNKEVLIQSIEDLKTSMGEFEDAKNSLQEHLPADEANFDTWSSSLKYQIQTLESARDQLIQKSGLSAHVHLLADGNPCPLCGSLTHPNPLQAEAENKVLLQIESNISELKGKLDAIFETSKKVSELSFKKEALSQQILEKEKELTAIVNQIKAQSTSLQAQGFEDIEVLKRHLKSTEEAILNAEQKSKQIKAQRKQWQEGKEDLEREDQKLRNLEQELKMLLTTQNTKRDDIKDAGFCQAFFTKDAGEIHQTIQKVQYDIDRTADLLSGIQKVLVEIRAKQATNLANLENAQKALLEAEKKIDSLEALYTQRKAAYHFEDEALLQELFHHQLDVDKVEVEIKNFEQRLHLVGNRIAEIKTTEGISSFNQEDFELLKCNLEEKSKALEAIKKDFTLLDRELKESKEKLAEKKKLQEIYEKLENRESNLKELERLFKGSGFVKYVSSIYLKELCNTANIRFNKLTKNSMSLEIDDNNTFWVVDYLNGGKKRLLKTLSGGQTFQASLCLALALAEKVKSLNEADQSFFFLDEGFGALDRNSLRVVFETLKALRHENRVVGIISHVEELQQEIEVYAKVELDAEKGSQVGYSF